MSSTYYHIMYEINTHDLSKRNRFSQYVEKEEEKNYYLFAKQVVFVNSKTCLVHA